MGALRFLNFIKLLNQPANRSQPGNTKSLLNSDLLGYLLVA